MRPALQDYADGIRVMLPLIPGSIPFGMIAGAVAAEVKLSAAQGIGASIIMFAGTAQLATMQLIAENAPALVVVLTGLVINLRFAMYSASLAPHFAGLSSAKRNLLAYVMTDQSYALSITRFARDNEMSGAAKFRFYIGGALLMWVFWIAATAAGYFLGNKVPPSWSLDFVVPLSFLALLVPGIRDSSTATAAAVGAGIAVAAWTLPFNLGLFLAAMCGIAAGYIVENRSSRKDLDAGKDL
ncbi:AzlC family protein [Parvibaculum lavamentivorans DS-1]|uniref:AzlC family protein n=1 Tax=Parvibaculum lavamentivorans (strain DS-1 / DSM 13023 / NCIMB 13966) TaxID=402881 RepID=A7HUJ4_PARL1|nr:AzlC family ABC transporter permease [Parvibaculum lavamentivorans]ABS63577.1 AzlC family protein [Parvibaculum lavamentivorans DS-1]